MSVRVTVNLPRSAVDALQHLAARRSTTVTGVLHHAKSLEQQRNDEPNRGREALLRGLQTHSHVAH